jgi:hypothetical protein
MGACARQPAPCGRPSGCCGLLASAGVGATARARGAGTAGLRRGHRGASQPPVDRAPAPSPRAGGLHMGAACGCGRGPGHPRGAGRGAGLRPGLWGLPPLRCGPLTPGPRVFHDRQATRGAAPPAPGSARSPAGPRSAAVGARPATMASSSRGRRPRPRQLREPSSTHFRGSIAMRSHRTHPSVRPAMLQSATQASRRRLLHYIRRQASRTEGGAAGGLAGGSAAWWGAASGLSQWPSATGGRSQAPSLSRSTEACYGSSAGRGSGRFWEGLRRWLASKGGSVAGAGSVAGGCRSAGVARAGAGGEGCRPRGPRRPSVECADGGRRRALGRGRRAMGGGGVSFLGLSAGRRRRLGKVQCVWPSGAGWVWERELSNWGSGGPDGARLPGSQTPARCFLAAGAPGLERPGGCGCRQQALRLLVGIMGQAPAGMGEFQGAVMGSQGRGQGAGVLRAP